MQVTGRWRQYLKWPHEHAGTRREIAPGRDLRSSMRLSVTLVRAGNEVGTAVL